MAVKTEASTKKSENLQADGLEIPKTEGLQVPVALHGRELIPNRRIPLDVSWVEEVRVNTSAVERRAASIGTRRTVKKDWQAAWLLRAISCMDLTTLSGDDSAERVRAAVRQGPPPARRPSHQSTGDRRPQPARRRRLRLPRLRRDRREGARRLRHPRRRRLHRLPRRPLAARNPRTGDSPLASKPAPPRSTSSSPAPTSSTASGTPSTTRSPPSRTPAAPRT